MLTMGIVGLPNVGKSTLFNSLIKTRKAKASNYPFCTIEPNVGVVEVRDERLYQLGDMVKTRKLVPGVMEFVDIAGLAKNASQGEGLGNQFLADIREVNAILEVLRFFEDKDIIHVEGNVDPKRDKEIIELELILADLAIIVKRIDKAQRASRSGDKEEKRIYEAGLKIKETLEKGNLASSANLSEEEKFSLKSLSLLTLKPILYVANVDEEQLRTGSWKDLISNSEHFVPICAKVEEELMDLDEEEKKEYLKTLNTDKSGLDRLVIESYRTLDLITFFTVGEKETRAWELEKGSKAVDAAGKIHSDFARGFIRAEIINWKTLLDCASEAAAVEKGLIRGEGRDYMMQDGDCVNFKFNV